MTSWPWIAGAASLPVLAGVLALGAADWTMPAGRSTVTAAYGLLIEALLIAIAAPLAGVACVPVRTTGASAATNSVDRLVGFMRPVAFPLAVTTLVSFGLAMIALRSANTSIGALVAAHVVLASTAFLFSAIGALTAVRLRHELDAALVACALALIAVGGVLAAGPRLADWPARSINALLTLTPPVAVGAAANIDVLHLDALYRLSPIAHVQFAYPPWPLAAAMYFTLALIGFAAAASVRPRRPEHGAD